MKERRKLIKRRKKIKLAWKNRKRKGRREKSMIGKRRKNYKEWVLKEKANII